ncbi:triphosphoribosyl-dephospho-CoA synthase CitG [Fructilactobacillus vespulae]|uniref:triphosphoribosyl-dephospho-CoA synthase CitG n=1 Tax=Fructilactobacillus vespulae TaxID=1249630 RepID=UPI0039B688B6
MDNKIQKLTSITLAKSAVVEMAVEAMLYEAVTWPKPGLVDPVSNRGHEDMDIFMFIKSSVGMTDYLDECYQAGAAFTANDLTELFQQIRPLGMRAEKKMFQKTNGVNTHKGALFIMGIWLAACGYAGQDQEAVTLQRLLAIEQAMTHGLVQNDLTKKAATAVLTAGQQQFQKYGYTGIRGETEAGFPLVMQQALPVRLTSDLPENELNLLTLFSLIAKNRDSNLIKRAHDPQLVKRVQTEAEQIVTNFQATGNLDQKLVKQLNQLCGDQHLSLGGSADLLILTIFLAKLFGHK